ncbi:FHA domain-containing protein [Peterkaempfera bronchialis]|uniref:FHA domain-containing protein n=1 Tax=Peterkaempfera bronchialis TaxID=2126346 RepID=UPI00389A8EE5
MSLFSKLFGRNSRRGAAEAPTARHRRAGEEPGGVPGMRGAPQGDEFAAPSGDRPLFRDQADGQPGGEPGGRTGAHGASVDPSGGPRIGFDAGPSTSGGGFAPDPYASAAQQGGPRQEAANAMAATVCTRCGNHNPEAARFCSNCGAPLRGGLAAERPAETTSTISISGLESYDPDATGTGTQPALSPEVLAAIDALPAGSALLIVRRGPNSGSRFLLDSDLTTAGRHPESDIFLDDVTVSRRHVEFRRTPTGFTVADVGSLNGTYVNRERIDEWTLSNGDEVQIGKYRLVFFAGHRGF